MIIYYEDLKKEKGMENIYVHCYVHQYMIVWSEYNY